MLARRAHYICSENIKENNTSKFITRPRPNMSRPEMLIFTYLKLCKKIEINLKSKTICGIVFYKFFIFILVFNKFGVICTLTGSFFSYHLLDLEYNNKSFENSPGLHAHQTAAKGIEQLQFWKQGPTLQKEGPDLYKGSNQLQIEILNKRSRAHFTVGNIHVYYLLPIFRKTRPSFIRVLQTMIRLC